MVGLRRPLVEFKGCTHASVTTVGSTGGSIRPTDNISFFVTFRLEREASTAGLVTLFCKGKVSTAVRLLRFFRRMGVEDGGGVKSKLMVNQTNDRKKRNQKIG